MNWAVNEAQEKFSELVEAAKQNPQEIYEQDHLVAVVIEAGLFQEFLAWRRQNQTTSIADAFAQLHQICAEEDYTLEVPPRHNRSDPFAEPTV